MIHEREDYNRFQDPENKIGEDEPVMLFRAQDKHFPTILAAYAAILEENGNLELASKVRLHIDRVKAWQKKNFVKEPDL